MINDFSVLPSDVREGQMSSYWYHEDTNAFFDDVDHYKMIKAMCKLSCSVCDKMDDQPHDASKRRARFKNINQLKGHLFHRHHLHMCNLCLEGRKVILIYVISRAWKFGCWFLESLFYLLRLITNPIVSMMQVFICEQKLYTRSQLKQHINTGDSEVDGSESERGGFMGHPMCDFCRTPFYGENEIYTHMSTEHFTCHICQR